MRASIAGNVILEFAKNGNSLPQAALPFNWPLGGNVFDVGRAAQFVDAQIKIQNAIIAQIQSATTIREQKVARHALDQAILTAQQRVATSTGETKTYAEQFLRSLEQIRAAFPDIAGMSSARPRREKAGRAARQGFKIASAMEKIRSQGQISTAQISGDTEGEFRAKLEQETVNTYKTLLGLHAKEKEALEGAEEVRKRLLAEHEKELADTQSNLILDKEGIEVLGLRAAGETQQADAIERTRKIKVEFDKLQKDGLTDDAEALRLATEKVDSEHKLKSAKEGTRTVQKEITDLTPAGFEFAPRHSRPAKACQRKSVSHRERQTNAAPRSFSPAIASHHARGQAHPGGAELGIRSDHPGADR